MCSTRWKVRRIGTYAHNMPTLLDYPGVSCIWCQWSPTLQYGSQNLPDRMDFWPFVCFSLKFSPWFFSQKLNTSCKTSYNVLISGQWGAFTFGAGGGGWYKKESQQILDRSPEVGTSAMPLYSLCSNNQPPPHPQPPPAPTQIMTGFYFNTFTPKCYYPRYSLFTV